MKFFFLDRRFVFLGDGLSRGIVGILRVVRFIFFKRVGVVCERWLVTVIGVDEGLIIDKGI